ncbi:glycosyltransferase family 4 protein [Thermodesulforhabdus norvegica]|uniref:UDP-N-acetylmuramyl pentapeptide phosphotransferase/UDP-N-acetylglucosamine-1-phosphate transferase n=1 Tax=Thermodesulforhabdus norvegica TaxID=39841 RepID=A0A1I4UPB1_9BACT|nr:MraY family glycosyltransferase [Thermodesulforhabdus norvegica]SFM90806.1 UDP-N-acetylmuramyl pentapeptide phosphotransferase/UDP-N-acetylglucosamine-1-phosphate transferase [Thermodesulforhabdus norvegica]
MEPGYLFLLISVFFLSWLAVMLLVPLVMRFANKYKLLDKPSERKVHQIPIPRVGGIALFSAFTISFAVFYAGLCYKLHLPILHILDKPQWIGLLIGGGLVFVTGLIDDVLGLTPGIKLIGQIIAASCAYFGGLTITQINLPFAGPLHLGWFSFPFTILWFLIIINGFNLLDGVDGLATTLTFVTGFFLLLYCLQNNREYLALPAVIIMGVSLGFLHFNMNPARIFMGDSGSYFLGFQLAALALKACTSEDGISSPGVPLLIFLVPLTDVLMATVRRILRGHGIFNPDTDHIHHCLLKKGFSQNAIISTIGLTTALTGTAGLTLPYLDPLMNFCLLSTLAFFLTLFMARIGYLSCLYGSGSGQFEHTTWSYISLFAMLWKYRIRVHKVREHESLLPILIEVLNPLQPDFARLELFHQPQNLPEIQTGYHKNVTTSEIKITKKSSLKYGTTYALTLNIPLVINNSLFGTFLIKNVPKVHFVSHRFVMWYVQKIADYLTSSLWRIYTEREKSLIRRKAVSREESAVPRRLVYVLIQGR